MCRFGYPKPLQPETTVVTEDEPTLLTARNDGMLNSFNPVQLSAWRANIDTQYIVSRRRVIDYCTKPRSESQGHLHQDCQKPQGWQPISEGSSEAPHPHRRRQRLLSTRDLPYPIAATHVQVLP